VAGCRPQELEAAFKGWAVTRHPDRYSTDVDKQQATKKLQVGVQAFQVRGTGWSGGGRLQAASAPGYIQGFGTEAPPGQVQHRC
jgi:hypothetical protein